MEIIFLLLYLIMCYTCSRMWRLGLVERNKFDNGG